MAARDGWTETTLGEVVALNPEATKDIAQVDEIVYVDLASVSAESGISTDLYRGNFGDAPGRARRVIRSNDVLVSTVRPYLKGFAQVPQYLDGAIASTGFTVLRANPKKVLSGFVWAIIGMNSFVEHLMDRATGSSYPAVRPKDIASFKLSVPSLGEQKRIVDVVSSVDAYIDALQQQVDATRTARNAVLHELLSAVGDDWTKTTLGDICDVRDGTHDSPTQSEVGFPLVTSKNIRDGRVDLSDVYLISESDFQEINKRSKVDQFDLLISMIGTVGEVCFESTKPNYAIKNVGLIKTGNEMLGRFLLGYLSSSLGKEQIELSTSGSTQKFIGLGKLRSIRVHLPPKGEQKRIVDIVSSMDDVIQSTKKAVADAKNLRSGLLSDLLSGNHAIPESYDEIMGAA